MDVREVLKAELMLTDVISDAALDGYIAAARARIEFPGVHPSHALSDEDPHVVEAVKAFVKAQYALTYEGDAAKYEAWMNIYDVYRSEFALAHQYREPRPEVTP